MSYQPQEPPRSEPELYLRAEAQLAEGDTLAAISSLRRLTSESPDFARAGGFSGACSPIEPAP